ncbi:MAG TPA: DUF2911 domain-containing protein [Bacteroidota bacterium]|nr:DUF2911 domain-containing protein [Bacteroidota bacterium]
MTRTISLFVFGILLASAVCESARSQQPILSPRDSVEISFGGKKISVNYGRPSIRGRKNIIGGLVPFNKWWRTGANEATAFVTEADLVIEGHTIPKGSYTFYTMPSEKQWKLMINKQTGQWGTVYNPDLDLVRLPLSKKLLKNPVEKFLITLAKTGSTSGVMKLTWENTELSLKFTVRKNGSR